MSDISIPQLRQFGFDCYAMDKVECPDGLRYYLQMEANLHRTVSFTFS